MIPATDLRAGKTFLVGNTPYQVTKYTHSKMGRGNAVIKVSARNLKSGGVEEKTFNSGSSVEPVSTTKKKLRYLYMDKTTAVFMYPKTYEQTSLDKKVLENALNFLKEGEEVNVLFLSTDSGEEPISLELPPNVVLSVKDAAPGVKGDSASNVYKDAVLESGLRLRVPLFINSGDRVKVDTRTGEYIERMKG